MRASREQFGNTGSVKTSLSKTKGSTETSTTGTDDESIVGMVNDRVLGRDRILGVAMGTQR